MGIKGALMQTSVCSAPGEVLQEERSKLIFETSKRRADGEGPAALPLSGGASSRAESEPRKDSSNSCTECHPPDSAASST